VRDISNARLDVLREWLRVVERINSHREEYRTSLWFGIAFRFTLMDATTIDRETTMLFGGWAARRQLAVYSLIGAYQRPSSLVSAVLDVFERTQKVVGLSARLHQSRRDEQALDRLIGWQRKLRSLLDNAYGTTLTASDVAWLIGSGESDVKGDLHCLSHYLRTDREGPADEESNHGRA
jgi:hypothetical protein